MGTWYFLGTTLVYTTPSYYQVDTKKLPGCYQVEEAIRSVIGESWIKGMAVMDTVSGIHGYSIYDKSTLNGLLSSPEDAA